MMKMMKNSVKCYRSTATMMGMGVAAFTAVSMIAQPVAAENPLLGFDKGG
jgi:hypothetical protein